MRLIATKKKNIAYPRYSKEKYVWEVRAIKDGITHIGYVGYGMGQTLEAIFKETTRPRRPSEIVMEQMDKEGKLRRSNETINNIE